MGFEYYSTMPEGMNAVMGIAGGLMIILLFIGLIAIAFGVLCYVFQSLGMYAIAKRRGIRKPWLAWIPVGNMWILGSISDQYQYVVKGKVRNRRKVLMGLTLALLATGIFMEIGLIAWGFIGSNPTGIGMAPMGILLVVLFYLAYFVLAILAAIFQYIALYDLYVSSEPANGTLYLVLSILMNVTLPFFVFACRNKDLGMPARKQPQPEAAVISAPETEAPAEPVAKEEVLAEPESESVAEVPATEEVVEEGPSEEPENGEE